MRKNQMLFFRLENIRGMIEMCNFKGLMLRIVFITLSFSTCKLWVDTWWANGDVSPSQMAEQKCDF